MRKRFVHDLDKRYLVVSGEHAEESPGRAKYLAFEKYRADNRTGKRAYRYIDHLRIVHQDSEKEVWERMKRWNVNPHPAYHVGLGRTSCKFCIFANADQWATMREFDHKGFKKVLDYEKQFNLSINRSGSFIDKIADTGNILDVPEGYFDIANSFEYHEPIIVSSWKLPSGAFMCTGGAI
jgi:3'-phosphoadenosine 5'-phosphosulfate sulfotransferase (PAPS reductase)/FAD synthetase